MTSKALQIQAGTQVDTALLIARLEKRILAGPLEKKWKDVLHDQRVINRLDPDQQLKMAALAQMAGEMEAALEIYALINKADPDLERAWAGRLELLALLDRRKECATLLAQIKQLDNKGLYIRCREIVHTATDEPKDNEPDSVSVPFENLHKRRAFLTQYAGLFCGREDCFARQWVNREENSSGYVPVRRAMTHSDIEDHLTGRRTYGIYLFSTDSTIRTAVLDVDISATYRGRKLDKEEKRAVNRQKGYLLTRLPELSQTRNLFPLLEFSGGKGYHLWYFFDGPVDPAPVRAVLEEIRREIAGDVPAFNIEVFPKQDKLSGKGFGNLVKLPLGVHRLTGKQSYFISGRTAVREEAAQMEMLSGVRRAAPDDIKQASSVTEKKNLIVHPGLKKYAGQYPELYRLEAACPPLGQLLVECRNRRPLAMREEKIIYQTIGFLPRGKLLIHFLFAGLPDYNAHLVDFRISRIRGTPLGCRRIHSLLSVAVGFCEFNNKARYNHPLLHLPQWQEDMAPVSSGVENLSAALEQLKLAIIQAQRFLI